MLDEETMTKPVVRKKESNKETKQREKTIIKSKKNDRHTDSDGKK